MVNAQTQSQTQDNPFGAGTWLDNILFALMGGSGLSLLTDNPAMGPWGMLAGGLLPELLKGGMFNPQEEEYVNPFENQTLPPDIPPEQWRQGFGVQPRTGQPFLESLDPQLFPAFQMATEQTANQNRVATENYNRWAQATEGAYQNAADILAARSGMYRRGSS